MEGPDGNALLVLGKRGKGRVALLLSDHIWLWARGYDGGGPYTDLMRRLAHWLMKEPDLEEETLKITSRGDTITIVRRTIKDAVDPVTLTSPSGRRDRDAENSEPGLWRKTLTAREQGVYRAASEKLASVVTVGNANARELASVTATDKPLQPILDQTGGGSFWLGRDDTDTAALPRIVMLRGGSKMHGSDWIGLEKRDAYRVEGVRLFRSSAASWRLRSCSA
jgi:hypothetical protein